MSTPATLPPGRLLLIQGEPVRTRLLDGVERLPECPHLCALVFGDVLNIDALHLTTRAGDVPVDTCRFVLLRLGIPLSAYQAYFPDDTITEDSAGDTLMERIHALACELLKINADDVKNGGSTFALSRARALSIWAMTRLAGISDGPACEFYSRTRPLATHSRARVESGSYGAVMRQAQAVLRDHLRLIAPSSFTGSPASPLPA